MAFPTPKPPQRVELTQLPRRCVNSPRRVRILLRGPDVSKTTCSIDGCAKPSKTRGWCSAHYERWRRLGHPLAVKERAPKPPPGPCQVVDCDRQSTPRSDWCATHYDRWKRHGDPNHGGPIQAWGRRVECSVEGCDRHAKARGWCNPHHRRWRRWGDPLGKPPQIEIPDCEIDGCERRAASSKATYCKPHLYRFKKYGDPLGGQEIRGAKINSGPCTEPGCSNPANSRGLCASHYWSWKSAHSEICSVDGCGTPSVVLSRSLCGAHYQKWQKYGDPLGKPDPRPEICCVSGCSQPNATRGHCGSHYYRLMTYGDPLGKPKRVDRRCSLEGCDKKHSGLGYCAAHYARFKATGDPQGKRPVQRQARPGEIDAFVERALRCPEDGCLPWPFGMSIGGYGKITITRERALHLTGKHSINMPAHRYILERAIGPAPDASMVVAHEPVRCHNRACCNPHHLRWATQSENMADKYKDGTVLLGERHFASKLTEEKVRRILEGGECRRALAAEFGVSQQLIVAVRKRQVWRWVDMEKGVAA